MLERVCVPSFIERFDKGCEVKRRVKWSDTQGLPLVHVKLFSDKDRSDLRRLSLSEPCTPQIVIEPVLKLSFTQPGSQLNFHRTVLNQHISLENVAIKGKEVFGTVCVHNLCFQKEVSLKKSENLWMSSTSIACVYDSAVTSGIDRFRFSFFVGLTFPVGGMIEFCFRYVMNGCEEWWDSNNGGNYRIKCVSLTPLEEEGGQGKVPVFKPVPRLKPVSPYY